MDAQGSDGSRKDEKRLERLVAASGFGHIQFVQAVSQLHQMVGRNVTFISDNPITNESVNDDRSHSTSISGSHEGRRLIPCRTSIAPIVSTQQTADHVPEGDEIDVEHKVKRHKHQESRDSNNGAKDQQTQHRRHQHRQFVTHYVIQLEPQGSVPVKNDSENSLSSSNTTSVEARLVGLSKTSLQQQRAAVGLPAATHTSFRQPEILQADESAESDDSSETKDSFVSLLADLEHGNDICLGTTAN